MNGTSWGLVSGRRRFDVDPRFGDFCQHGICLLFLLEGVLEQTDDFIVAKQFGQRTRGAVAGDFVVLDALCRCDETGVADCRARLFVQEVLAFFDEPVHRLALVTRELDAEGRRRLLKAFDVVLGLIEVLFEPGPQALMVSGSGHLWQCLEELSLCAVKILQLLVKQIFERFEFHSRR